MYAYLYVIFFVLAAMAILSVITTFRREKWYAPTFWTLVFVFFLLSFLRWERGADWRAYYKLFENYTEYFSVYFGNFEMGFRTLSAFVRNTVGSYTFFLFLQAGIITFCMSRLMWRYSLDPLYSLFVYFALIFANIFFVRQYVAIAITMYAFTFIVQRRFWPFAFCLLCALVFHTSALIFLLAYPLYRLRFKTGQWIWILGGSIVVSLLISQFMLSFFGDMGGFVGEKIAHYLRATDGGSGSMKLPTLGSLVTGLMSRTFILVLILTLLGRARLQDERLNGIVNFYFAGIILYSFTAPISNALVRMVNYYDFFTILLIPYFIYRPRILFNRFLIALVMTLYLFTRFVSLSNQYGRYGDPSPFTPYKSIFNKEKHVEGVY